MIRINPDNIARLELTSKEQEVILQNCQSLDSDIYERIMNSPDGVLHLFIDDCMELQDSIHLELERTPKPEIQNSLLSILQKLSVNSKAGNLADEISGHDFGSIEEINHHLQGVMDERNNTPDPEMGGLSHSQVARLLYSNWDDKNCPIKFNKNLTIKDLKNSPFFHNARLLLNVLLKMEKENTATAKGNLTRKVVSEAFEKLIMPEFDRNSIVNYYKTINELDVRCLHNIRVVCENIGLIQLEKKKFLVNKEHVDLLEDKNAGKLFYLLFFGYFRKFNIGYVDRLAELESVQDTISYSFYRLCKIGKKKVSIKKLKKQIFLPAVLKELEGTLNLYYDPLDYVSFIVESRIINPLELFGLIKCSYVKEYKNYKKKDKVQKTKLFDKFMKFEI